MILSLKADAGFRAMFFFAAFLLRLLLLSLSVQTKAQVPSESF